MPKDFQSMRKLQGSTPTSYCMTTRARVCVCVCVCVCCVCVTGPRGCLWRRHAEAGFQSCRPGCLLVWCLSGSPLGASPGSEPLGLGGHVASVPTRALPLAAGGGQHSAIPLFSTRSRALQGASRCSALRRLGAGVPPPLPVCRSRTCA